jgi:hypothetical protein
MAVKMNWFGLAGGALTLAVVIISLFTPWWQLTAGDNLITASLSPFTTGFSILGTSFTIPLIWASNLAVIFSLTAAGIIMLIYSAVPTKPYSKQLLSFAYNKPLFSIVAFVVLLFAMTVIIRTLLNLNIPLSGSSTSSLPTALTQGVTVSVRISTGFEWPFWLGVAATGLCIAARLYHRKIANA